MNPDNNTRSAASGNSTSASELNNVTLRIVILAHGNAREDDLYLVLSLDTTLGTLKRRIQESLPQHPPPEHQRIIYSGRGLNDETETLRNILRQDARNANTSHVLHLVIRQDLVGALAPTTTSSHVVPRSTSNTPADPNIPAQHAQVQIPNSQTGRSTAHNHHMALHNQMHVLQHTLQHQQALARAQLATRTALNNAGQDQARQQHLLSGSPQTTRSLPANQSPPSQQIPSIQSQIPNGPQTNPHLHGPIPALQPGHPATAGPIPHLPHVHAAQGGSTSLPHPLGNTTQTRTTIHGGPTGTTTMTFRVTGPAPPDSLNRSSSAPGSSPTAETDPANNVVNPMMGNIRIQPQPPAIPMGWPFPPGIHLTQQVPNILPNIPTSLPQLPFHNPSSQPMAWLLSSPSGPQGIVFAPGHGFFYTSPSTTDAAAQPVPTPTASSLGVQPTAPAPQPAQPVARAPVPATVPPHPAPGARPIPPAAGLAVPPVPQPAARARPGAGNNQDDLLQFIVNRVWLFIRLYAFVFVFSESGSWRRMLLIGAIIIYCLLPQRNPLTDGLQVLRRHFDNLIGPPNIPQRQPQQPQQTPQTQPADRDSTRGNNEQPAGPQAESSSSVRQRPGQMPTPEEAARRLLAREQQRNPNPVIDVLYRLEQGIVLFLASLVPGVGERHVRAREAARRIVQEEEDEQQRRIEAQQQDAASSNQNQPSEPETSQHRSEAGESESRAAPLPEGWKTTPEIREQSSSGQGSSSGVEATRPSEAEGLRPRGTNVEE